MVLYAYKEVIERALAVGKQYNFLRFLRFLNWGKEDILQHTICILSTVSKKWDSSFIKALRIVCRRRIMNPQGRLYVAGQSDLASVGQRTLF